MSGESSSLRPVVVCACIFICVLDDSLTPRILAMHVTMHTHTRTSLTRNVSRHKCNYQVNCTCTFVGKTFERDDKCPDHHIKDIGDRWSMIKSQAQDSGRTFCRLVGFSIDLAFSPFIYLFIS